MENKTKKNNSRTILAATGWSRNPSRSYYVIKNWSKKQKNANKGNYKEKKQIEKKVRNRNFAEKLKKSNNKGKNKKLRKEN